MKGKRTYKVLIFCSLLFSTTAAYSQDTINVALPDGDTKNSYWKSLFHGNIDRTHEKRMDFSFISLPSWARDASFGLGGMAAGLYRIDRTDSIMPPSDITAVFNASIIGHYTIGAKGNNYFRGNRSLLSYQLDFSSKPLQFWGIGYDACSVNPAIDYTRNQYLINANYQYNLLKNFYIGGFMDVTYTSVAKIDDISYLEGQKKNYFVTGVGISFVYDSRDFIPNATRGVYVLFRQTGYPSWMGNCNGTYWQNTLIIDAYTRVWKGGILAADLYRVHQPEKLPWPLKEQFGSNQRMRGYYPGRYMDNEVILTQIELRQHIVRRFGCAVWIGGGTVLPTLEDLAIEKTLPNYGIGLRWEFKHNMNVRVDYGFGKDTRGLVLNIGEAF